MRHSTKIHSHHQRLHVVLLCRAAVVPQDPHPRSRAHPPAPGLDRLAVAEAEPRPAGPPGIDPGAQGRDADLAAGFGIGTTTAWRYVNETVALLTAWAPKLCSGDLGRE